MFTLRNLLKASRPNPSAVRPLFGTSQILQQTRRFRTTSPLAQQYRYGHSSRSHTYSRFQRTTNALHRWTQRETFYIEVGALSAAIGGFYVYNLEKVPISGRTRFNLYGPDYEKNMPEIEVTSIIRQFRGGHILPDTDPRTRQVKRVLNRLIPVCGLTDLNWEVYVVESEQVNACVVPGGKVIVFTGILPFTKDDDGLAAVLGHEISHAVARHASERLSRYSLLWVAAVVSDLLFGTGALGQMALYYVLETPNSRTQETEADYLGLLLMAQACYDPRGAVRFWSRMAKSSDRAPPEFISTHPSPGNRMQKIEQWIPEAEQIREKSDCGATLGLAKDFQKSLPAMKW